MEMNWLHSSIINKEFLSVSLLGPNMPQMDPMVVSPVSTTIVLNLSEVHRLSE